MKHLQGSDDVIFTPAGRWRPDARRARRRGAARRDAAARRRAERHYGERLAALDPGARLRPDRRHRQDHGCALRCDRGACDPTRGPGPRGANARSSRQSSCRRPLLHAIVSLSQLIAYVNFQSRVLAGLRMLRAKMTKPMRDFTHGELKWQPWITPVDLDAATEAQLHRAEGHALEPRGRRLFAGAGARSGSAQRALAAL